MFKNKYFLGFCIILFLFLCTSKFSYKEETCFKQDGVPYSENSVVSVHDKWVEDNLKARGTARQALIALVKEQLYSPKSFKHLETKSRVENEDIIFYMRFECKNEYGAEVERTVKAIAKYSDLTVTILEIY